MKRSLVVLGVTLLAAAKPVTAADMWGCEVLLCLSNPAGPTAVAECVPPVSRLWKHLAKGHAFPTCPMASSSSTGRSYASVGTDYFNVCPKGTTMVAEGRPPVTARDSYDAGAPRLCGGTVVGTRTLCEPGDGGCYGVPIYDTLTSMNPYVYGGVIDVYISDAFFQRVRWQDNAWGSGDDPARKGTPVASGACVGYIACAR